MECGACHSRLPDDARFCPHCGAAAPSDARINTEQDVGSVRGNLVGTLMDDTPTDGFRSSTRQRIDTVESGGSAVGTILGGKGSPVHVGGQQHYGDSVQGGKRVINTGGGSHIEGPVHTGGGDFVGRDKNIRGDSIGGDKITTGNISGSSGVAIGRGASASVSQGLSGDDLRRLFAAIYQRIEARPESVDVDKDELRETVQKVENEVAKGEQANATKVERWLKALADVAPDVVGVAVAALTNPAAGVAAAVRAVAERVKRQISPAD